MLAGGELTSNFFHFLSQAWPVPGWSLLDKNMNNIKTIFVTGISGYIGGSLAVVLKKSGYSVLGLVRRGSDAAFVQDAGMIPVRGDLNNTEVIVRALEQCDAVIHTAECDNPVIASVFLAHLRGTGKTFIYTSGSAIVANWQYPETSSFVFTEDFPLESREPFPNRVDINKEVLRASLSGVRSIVIVPGMVYGTGLFLSKKSKQIPLLASTAKQLGNAVYIGDGNHRWSQVHIEDLAELYLAAMERAKPGSLFFAENGDASFKEMALAIHNKLQFAGQPVSLSQEKANEYWGKMMATVALGSDCRINADKARLFLHWSPTHTSFSESIDI
ncbi:NAD-dependent epimerase/dehydratase family protein [Sodalis ligni]|uniref:NAD-dependent epimerase/dehydratase family protein n=1 Tax=Sodalis ligni TaxID=2697027 RepID=UPI001049222D|nr:NAD-dependent epimerase/dehydratase family protein [Sodalis ligni]